MPSPINVIYVCQQNPWRLNGGALIRNYWFIRGLAERYRVHVITADNAKSPVPADFAARCASISRFPRAGGKTAPLRRLGGMLRPAASYYTSGTVSAAMKARVLELTRVPRTVAFVDLNVIEAVRPYPMPVVYQAHNAEAEHLRRRASTEASRPVRAFVRLDAARLQRIERELVRRSLAVAVCSAADRDDLSSMVPAARQKMLVAPNGVDLQRYEAVAGSRGDGRTVLITGSYDWRPNIVGLMWFLDEVLPVLRRLVGSDELRIRVAGRMSAALAARIDALPLMTASPNPADMRTELGAATVVAAPIRSSSGTRLRILEAWAAGRPVLTTTAGAFGLDYAGGDDVAIADDPRTFAHALVRLMSDEAEQQRLRTHASERARHYAWPLILERFLRESEPFLETVSLI